MFYTEMRFVRIHDDEANGDDDDDDDDDAGVDVTQALGD